MNRDRVAFWMFVLLLGSYVINAMDRTLFSVLATDVRGSLDLTVAQVGLAATIFTLGMGVAGIPTGYLLGRMSRKNVASLGLLIFSVATFLTAYVQGLPDLLIYRFVTGLGEAMQLTALLAIGTTYFYKHRGVAASSLNFTFGIGAIIGPNLGAAILSGTDWHMPFKVFGLLGIVILVPILIFVKPWFTEFKVEQKDKETAEPIDERDLADSIWSKKPILLALATVFAGLAIYSYLGLYPTYLREALGFTPQQAGLAVSFYGLGALLSLFGGWIGELPLCHPHHLKAILLLKDKLAASLAISTVISLFLFTITLGTYFFLFDYSHVWKASISSAFNWENPFPYVYTL